MWLALHIFRKDTRRLWWEIVVTLGLLIWLARLDSYRADALPGSIEGALNILLPVAWSYLIILLIREEAPVGDKQFWITRPYPWPSLLGAKALFALSFVHIPSLWADCAILVARGFAPSDCLAALVWKQVLIAAVLTLPIAALAAVTRNPAQLLLAALVILAFGLVVGIVEPVSRPDENVRKAIPLSGLAATGALILWLQYARRRTNLARALGTTAVLLGSLVFVFIPRAFTFSLHCAVSRIGIDPDRLSLHSGSEQVRPHQYSHQHQLDRVALTIPVAISGVESSTGVLFDQLQLEILSPKGEQWIATNQRAGMWLVDHKSGWLNVQLDRSFYEQIKGARVKVRGKLAAILYREQDVARLPALNAASLIPGIGRCFSVLAVDDGAEMLKVVCESPLDPPLFLGVTLVHPDSGEVWDQRLRRFARYSMDAWLSPLNRSQAFFRISIEARRKDSKYVVPRSALPQAEIVLVAAEQIGCTILTYEMLDVCLQEFEVERQPR